MSQNMVIKKFSKYIYRRISYILVTLLYDGGIPKIRINNPNAKKNGDAVDRSL